jgi:hypothetical protein
MCGQHCTGVVNLNRHLRELHRTPVAQRRQVLEYFAQFSIVDPSTVELPEEPAALIPELGAPLSGMQCKTCSFKTIDVNVIRKHCRKIH